ncbi:amidohydrolase family protein [Hyphomonas johnsonii]|uniref:Amidohydrolase family protein n=1 Tax=Hyphomonas johnsonii MHS-2 TaxID=1280950 RepID=A0A059FTZ5_9PROT|nr:amidohydrolase family protein [Hyphomonas johnsonii]KCZ93933.1 amidohydrolase family protein [Hyphomonas johnsonii MHS-2]
MMKPIALAALGGALWLGACTHDAPVEPETLVETPVAAAPSPVVETFSVLLNNTRIGELEATRIADDISVAFEYRNNGRGPTLAESITLGDDGLPVGWTVDGNTTFGNKITESFSRADGTANWVDTTGPGSAPVTEPAIYIAQNASPYALAVYSAALLADDDQTLPAYPAGALRLEALETTTVDGTSGAVSATAYALTGESLDPTYFLLDESEALFAMISPNFVIVRAGYEEAEQQLKDLAVSLSTTRFETIQARTAHTFDSPVRIADVRLFDPVAKALTGPVSVLVEGDTIKSIDAANASQPNETVIDGNGGTLVPGLTDMHAHLGQDDALLNIAAGITLVRDMGNNNDTLNTLIEKMDSGVLAGPRVVKNGFIEGKSPFSSNNGTLVTSEAEAVAAVDRYADEGNFFQIKIYNSMNPAWVPAMVAEARKRGLGVTGHVPAFTNANAMIEAGYDEMTHINQVMLGWVLAADEDTRTLLRLTALQRLPKLDLDNEIVQHTLDLMVDNDVAIDPTYAIHEALLLSRNGEIQPGMVDYVDHMPVGVQRDARSAWSNIETPEDDAAYAGAFDQITDTLKRMKDRGIFIVFGTDMGGSFVLHRELELYQNIGFTPAEILARATLEEAAYMGLDDQLGSITPGKKADFFLVPGNPVEDFKAIKTIALVSKNGTIYFPSEIYPWFGIEPFTGIPAVTAPAAAE